MNAVRADLRRAFLSWGFLAAAGVLCLCLVFSPFAVLKAVLTGEMDIAGQPQTGAALCLEAAAGSVFLSALPIAAALPFTAAFAEDVETNFVRTYLPRSGRTAYLQSRILAAALSGGGAVCAGELLGLAALSILLGPASAGMQTEESALSAQLLTAEWAARLLLSFLSGALWALAGLLAAAVSESRYMAWTVPFVSYYLLVILTQRYFPFLYALNPEEWISPGPAWQAGILGAVLILSEFITVLALAAGSVMRRRLEDV